MNILENNGNMAIIDDPKHGRVCLIKSDGGLYGSVDPCWGNGVSIKLQPGDTIARLLSLNAEYPAGVSYIEAATRAQDSDRPIINDRGIARRAGLIG